MGNEVDSVFSEWGKHGKSYKQGLLLLGQA